MTSVLRQLQAEWNSLVPAAQARGVPRVRMLNQPLETIAYRRAKLEWLRDQVGPIASQAVGDFTFGVEIECILPQGQSLTSAARAITAAGVPCEHQVYGHSNITGWKIVTDGSLNNYQYGCEVVSPVLRGEEGFRQMRIVCDTLTAIRAKVTKSCGLHVHVGVGTEPIKFFKNLIQLYASSEATIDTFMSPSRRLSNNSFCRTLSVNNSRLNNAETVDQIAYAIGQEPGRASYRQRGRYCKLNVQSYWMHKTVEFRHHQGTVEATKTEHWVRLVLRMCSKARGEWTMQDAMDVRTLQGLMDTVGASQTEASYFQGRVNHFNRPVRARAA